MCLDRDRAAAMRQLMDYMEQGDSDLAVELIQDQIEPMKDFLDKTYIIDMLQVIIGYNHELIEDLDDIKERYL